MSPILIGLGGTATGLGLIVTGVLMALWRRHAATPAKPEPPHPTVATFAGKGDEDDGNPDLIPSREITYHSACLKLETTHVVIVFTKSTQKDRKDVELVPRSWLTLKRSNRCTCKYPPSQEYSNVEKWVRESRAPNSEWNDISVQIIKEAVSYDQGVRRLERSFVESNVNSTSGDETNDKKVDSTGMPLILTNDKKDAELNEAPPMIENLIDSDQDLPCNDDERPLSRISDDQSIAIESDERSITKELNQGPIGDMSNERPMTSDDSNQSIRSQQQSPRMPVSDDRSDDKTIDETQTLDKNSMQTPISNSKRVIIPDDSGKSELYIHRVSQQTPASVRRPHINAKNDGAQTPINTSNKSNRDSGESESNIDRVYRQTPTSSKRPYEKSKNDTLTQTPIQTSKRSYQVITPDSSDENVTPTRETVNRRRNKKLVAESMHSNQQVENDSSGSELELSQVRQSTPGYQNKSRNAGVQILIKTPKRNKRAITPAENSISTKKLKKYRSHVISPEYIESNRQQTEPIETDEESLLDKKLKAMEYRILSKIDSNKRSILYDMNKKSQEIKQTITLNSKVLGTTASEQRKVLGTNLPITSLAEFIRFEESLPEKEQAVKSVMMVACCGSGSIKEGVANILKSIMGKSVQQVYSGCGRKVKGEGKRNFSETKTFGYMKDVLLDKHSEASTADILSKTSRWLSGWVDRDGGRAVRIQGSQQ